jgi:hypothetical protein
VRPRRLLLDLSSDIHPLHPQALVFLFVLERHIHPRTESGDFAIYDHQIEFVHFRHAQVAQRFCCGFYCVFRRILPGTLAGADELCDSVDAACACSLTHCILLYCLWVE